MKGELSLCCRIEGNVAADTVPFLVLIRTQSLRASVYLSLNLHWEGGVIPPFCRAACPGRAA